jgi:hypothetical protein
MKEMLNPTSMVMGAGLGQVREMGETGETGETRWGMDKMGEERGDDCACV